MSKITVSKLGIMITAVACAMLAIVAVVCTVSLAGLFINAETDTLEENSQVSSRVLQHALETRFNEAQMISSLLADDSAMSEAVKNGDKAALASIWDTLSKSNGIFALFANSDGIIVYKTDNCTLASASLFDAINTERDGMFSDPDSYIFYRSTVKFDGGSLAVGFRFDDYSIVDEVKEQTDAHATVFYDNLRISTTLVNSDGTRAVGTTMTDEIYEHVITNGELYYTQTELFGEKYMARYVPIVDDKGMVKGALFTGSPMQTMIDNRNRAILIGIVIGAVIIIISIFILIIFISKQISKPITMVKKMAVEIERGNLKNNPGITETLSKNEIGDVAESLWTAINNLDKYIGDISDMMSAMADGNFGYKSNVEYSGDFISIGESANSLSERMRDVIESINISADEVYSGSEQIANGASVLADGTTRQAAATEELSSSLDDISQNISRNAENAEMAQKLSNSSIEMVNRQNSEIGNMLDAMKNIEDSTGEISKIIKAIEDIAFQTNILALNAAVEAARAGAAGKGFAVVADEVRNLANKSAEAAGNTSTLIGSCVEAVNNGSAIAKKTADAMKKVIEITNETNNLIDGITQQTLKQEEAVQQVKSGIDQISDVIQENSATAEESAASCQELNAQAMTLREKISIFRT